MESYDPEDLIKQHEEEQRTRGELASQALEWFLEDENAGQLYPRNEVVEELSEHLGVSPERANVSISDTVGDIVDPVQQLTKERQKYVGVIEYKLFSDEGAYGYIDLDDIEGRRKRVVCAKCVEDSTRDENVTHATQGEGSSPEDASWQQLLNKVTSHYTSSHKGVPEDIEPGASLVSGTTISGNTTFHAGNDGVGSGLDADSLEGNEPGDLGGGSELGFRDIVTRLVNLSTNGRGSVTTTQYSLNIYGTDSRPVRFSARFEMYSDQGYGTVSIDGSNFISTSRSGFGRTTTVYITRTTETPLTGQDSFTLRAAGTLDDYAGCSASVTVYPFI